MAAFLTAPTLYLIEELRSLISKELPSPGCLGLSKELPSPGCLPPWSLTPRVLDFSIILSGRCFENNNILHHIKTDLLIVIIISDQNSYNSCCYPIELINNHLSQP